MGIHDRDYMRVDRPKKKSPGKISLWKRIRFWLHLLFRRGSSSRQEDKEAQGKTMEKGYKK